MEAVDRALITIPTYSASAASEAIPLIPLAPPAPGRTSHRIGRDADPESSSSDLEVDLDDDSRCNVETDHAYNLYPRAPRTYAEIRRHVRSFRSKSDIEADRLLSQARGSGLTGKGHKGKMQLLDNLRGWTKEKRYRYIMLLGLSLAGDGW